ncbi:MAG: hypothetical protein ABI729_07450 [Chitinophagales bacterium]
MLKNKKSTPFIKYFWYCVLGSITSFFLMLLLAAVGAFVKMPSFEEIENPRSSLATEVYSSDGVLLGKYYFQNRSTSSFEEIPVMIRNCLTATEDVRFYSHCATVAESLFANPSPASTIGAL